MTIVVPILSNPLSRTTSRLPYLSRSLRPHLWEGHLAPILALQERHSCRGTPRGCPS